MAVTADKIKVEDIDSREVNEISITKVANDWGIELFPKNKNVILSYCPNPNHNDENLGSCYFVENADKNFFYCFSCGVGGGPIDLVMLVDNCSFVDAINKLGRKYGLVRHKYIDKADLPPRWEGLSCEEYKLFGLKNVSIKTPKAMNENGEVYYGYERLTLRDLARQNPEIHDSFLIEKFIEKMYALANFYSLLETGKMKKYNSESGSEFDFNDKWEDAIIKIANRYKSLLQKGLCDKKKIDELFVDREEEIEKKIKDELRKAFAKTLGINKA